MLLNSKTYNAHKIIICKCTLIIITSYDNQQIISLTPHNSCNSQSKLVICKYTLVMFTNYDATTIAIYKYTLIVPTIL